VPYDTTALPEPSPGCVLTPDASGHLAADYDLDGDIDSNDFAVIQRCWSGENMPSDPGC
jgi:hypothetical protein